MMLLFHNGTAPNHSSIRYDWPTDDDDDHVTRFRCRRLWHLWHDPSFFSCSYLFTFPLPYTICSIFNWCGTLYWGAFYIFRVSQQQLPSCYELLWRWWCYMMLFSRLCIFCCSSILISFISCVGRFCVCVALTENELVSINCVFIIDILILY